MIYSSICNEAQCRFTEPLPEHNILIHRGRLQLGFLAQVEYLEGPGLCLERNNLLCPVHDSTIGFDWSPDDIVTVLKVDDYDFGRCCFVLLLADTNEGIGFECLRAQLVMRP